MDSVQSWICHTASYRLFALTDHRKNHKSSWDTNELISTVRPVCMWLNKKNRFIGVICLWISLHLQCCLIFFGLQAMRITQEEYVFANISCNGRILELIAFKYELQTRMYSAYLQFYLGKIWFIFVMVLKSTAGKIDTSLTGIYGMQCIFWWTRGRQLWKLNNFSLKELVKFDTDFIP